MKTTTANENSRVMVGNPGTKEPIIYGRHWCIGPDAPVSDIDRVITTALEDAKATLEKEGLEDRLEDVQILIKSQAYEYQKSIFSHMNVGEPPYGGVFVAWKLKILLEGESK